MNATLPLLAPRALEAPIAWRTGAISGTAAPTNAPAHAAISAAQFVAEACALAEQLPAQGTPVNLCKDRYHFALALAAALLRGQTSQMLPSAAPALLAELLVGHAQPYVLCDDPALDTGSLPRLAVARPQGLAPASEVPCIPAALPAVCLLTSGSTGTPQPHTKTWGQLVLNIGAEAQRLAEILERPSLAGLTVVATVPAQHSYGLESTVLLALLGGANFEAGRPFYPADIAQSLAGVPAPRGLVTTPFHLKTLLLAKVALPATELLLSATAPLSPQLAAQAEAQLQGRLVEIYGCTEAGQVAARRTTEGETWTTLGELRLWHEPAVVMGDSAAAPRPERFMVAGGHVSRPEPLGDLLDLQDERRFRLLGRANDLIHVAGKRSSLAHLSFQLNRIAGVEDGAFWMPAESADSVTRPIALVVAPSLSAAQIIQALRPLLDPAFLPRKVLHVSALPRETTGKLTALKLAQFARAALAADAQNKAQANTDTPAETQAEPRIQIPAEHPAFDGHFPGQPVLPGVVLLSLVMQAIAAQPAWRERLGPSPSLEQVKFLAAVGPGAELRVVLREEGRGLGFDVLKATQASPSQGENMAETVVETVVCKGQLSAPRP